MQREDEVKITIRLSSEIRDAIVRQAKEEQRSLNGQITYVLKEATKKKVA